MEKETRMQTFHVAGFCLAMGAIEVIILLLVVAVFY